MGANVNVTLPKNIAEYIKRKSRDEYLPVSAVARRYIAMGVVEEMVLDYHKKGFSIHKISQLTDTPVVKVLEILSKVDEELEDLEEELEEMRNG